MGLVIDGIGCNVPKLPHFNRFAASLCPSFVGLFEPERNSQMKNTSRSSHLSIHLAHAMRQPPGHMQRLVAVATTILLGAGAVLVVANAASAQAARQRSAGRFRRVD
jgi:hypothetical protein